MKLINKKPFTIRDFEQGLMLAGYVTPINADELTEKEMLYDYDKQNNKAKQIIYFKRSVLAAEIINELKDEKTFGRIKFQKLVYLCENVVHMNLSEDRYKKFAAGPFDNRFMHSINKELKDQKWFDVKIIKDGKYYRPQYTELENKYKYKEYYNDLYSKYDEDIHRVISLLRKQKTDYVELIATIFFCWKELIDEKKKFSNSIIYDKVYSWAEEKNRFSKSEIDRAIKWMENEELTPISIE
jgi:hypothetical protein